MEMWNRAVDGADAYQKMMHKIEHQKASSQSPEVLAWNAEVDRKRAEKKDRKFRENESKFLEKYKSK